MAQVKIFGYADKISVKPGEVIQFHVNADGANVAEAHLVRLIHGDAHPDGPGFVEEEVDCAANGVWQVEKQFTQVGSFLEVADPRARAGVGGQPYPFRLYPSYLAGRRASPMPDRTLG